MPNFWSRGLQYLEEKLGADITSDKDLEITLKKIEITEKGLSSLRLVLQNFNSYIDKFCLFFKDLNKALSLIYENTPYFFFVEEFLCKQQLINTHFQELTKLTTKLYSKTSEWNRIFDTAKNQLVERENKRKIYDHYEKKLIKLQKTKDKKLLERNEEKYTKAASEYVDCSEKIYKLMQDSLKLCYKLTNPLISELIIGEKNLFDGISMSLSCFKDNLKRFNEIESSINNPNYVQKTKNYDPLKFMKEKDLIKRISIRKNSYVNPFPNKDEDNKRRKSSIFSFGSKNENIQKKEENKGNFNNILSQTRLTNTFGNLPEKKLEEFYNIEDDLHYSFI